MSRHQLQVPQTTFAFKVICIGTARLLWQVENTSPIARAIFQQKFGIEM
jgi:hypothetical protein